MPRAAPLIAASACAVFSSFIILLE
jgi:hypothetical protein